MITFPHLDAVEAAVGQELGTGPRTVVDQSRIDVFAQLTRDDQWIHVDPVRAADGPYGRTIAHGLLSLSLIPELTEGVFDVENLSMSVNYGFDRVRFPSPVVSGSTIQASVKLAGVRYGEDHTMVTLTVTVTADGATKPAVVADWLLLLYPA